MDTPEDENKKPNTAANENWSDAEKPFDPADMEARAERLRRQGRMPTFEEFVKAMIPAREEYVHSLKEQRSIPPDYRPYGLIDVLQKLLNARTATKPSESVSIGDYQRVRDELREIIGQIVSEPG